MVVLGHLQRGGPPTTFDRVLGTRFGAAAARLIRKGEFGQMVALMPPDVESVPIRDAIGRRKTVPLRQRHHPIGPRDRDLLRRLTGSRLSRPADLGWVGVQWLRTESQNGGSG